MLAEEIIPAGKFTRPQLELLRMFYLVIVTKKFPDDVWVEIKDLLSAYFMEKASGEMDNLFKQEGWGDDKIKEWTGTHIRTLYNKNDQ